MSRKTFVDDRRPAIGDDYRFSGKNCPGVAGTCPYQVPASGFAGHRDGARCHLLVQSELRQQDADYPLSHREICIALHFSESRFQFGADGTGLVDHRTTMVGERDGPPPAVVLIDVLGGQAEPDHVLDHFGHRLLGHSEVGGHCGDQLRPQEKALDEVSVRYPDGVESGVGHSGQHSSVDRGTGDRYEGQQVRRWELIGHRATVVHS
jgi:hypothetical protein